MSEARACSRSVWHPDGCPRRFLALLGLTALLPFAIAGCRSGRASSDVAVLEPLPEAPAAPPPADPAVTPSPSPASGLELADRAFEAGDYPGAVAGYRAYLDLEGAGLDADRALYRLAVLDLLDAGHGRDPATAYALLRRLVREHPQSPYRMEAEVILGLSTRLNGLETKIDRLETQLEALKRIDLERSPARRSP